MSDHVGRLIVYDREMHLEPTVEAIVVGFAVSGERLPLRAANAHTALHPR
jgi:hypothetical protein